MVNEFEFGPFVLNARERRFTRAGKPIHLQPKAFEVLLYLLEHAGCLVGKQEVLDSVWKDVFVTENSLTVCVRQIRIALGDEADAPQFIETVPTAGYRFIADVVQLDEPADSDLPAQNSQVFPGIAFLSRWTGLGVLLVLAALAFVAFDPFHVRPTENEHSVETGKLVASSPDSDRWQNSIAVLPFVNISGDPENEYFADGLSEEIINLLARTPGLMVIGRTSSFTFKDRAEDLREIGRTLGVQTLLEGSVRKSGEQVRITTQLIDSAGGDHLWAARFDRKLEAVRCYASQLAPGITG